MRKSPAEQEKVALSEGVRRPEVDVDLGLMRESVSFQLRHAAWAVHNAFARHFAPADAVPRQYSVLYLIGRNPGVSVKALAAAIGVDQSTLVPTLNICEERGWLRRDRGKPDRRLVALDLTAEGRLARGLHRACSWRRSCLRRAWPRACRSVGEMRAAIRS